MIWNNIKTVLLLAMLSTLFVSLGYFLGGTNGLRLAFIFSLFMNGVMYFFSDKIVLSMYRARPLDKDQHADIYGDTEELARSMGIPMPKMWLIRTPIANAFATGRNPKHGRVRKVCRRVKWLPTAELLASATS